MTAGTVLGGSGLVLEVVLVARSPYTGPVGALLATAGASFMWTATRAGLPVDHLSIVLTVIGVGLALGVATVGGVQWSLRAAQTDDQGQKEQCWRWAAVCLAPALVVTALLPHSLA